MRKLPYSFLVLLTWATASFGSELSEVNNGFSVEDAGQVLKIVSTYSNIPQTILSITSTGNNRIEVILGTQVRYPSGVVGGSGSVLYLEKKEGEWHVTEKRDVTS